MTVLVALKRWGINGIASDKPKNQDRKEWDIWILEIGLDGKLDGGSDFGLDVGSDEGLDVGSDVESDVGPDGGDFREH